MGNYILEHISNWVKNIASLGRLAKTGNKFWQGELLEAICDPPQPDQGKCERQRGVIDLDADYCPFCGPYVKPPQQ